MSRSDNARSPTACQFSTVPGEDGQAEREKYLPSTQSPVPTIFHRFGIELLITNVCAAILLLVAVLVLSFFWFTGDTNESWRQVILNGWIGQAVTLSTLAIRLAVATQSGTAVAMLSALSLESPGHGHAGVLFQQTAALSLMRHANMGPITSFCSFWENTGLRENRRIFLLVALLGITSIVSQFTSTLLLWDVRSGDVRGFATTSTANTGVPLLDFTEQVSIDFPDVNYWSSPAKGFALFAEWTEKPKSLPDYIMDTGPSARAFLPFSFEDSSIATYEGSAALFDSRVVCMRPELGDFQFMKNETVIVPEFTGSIKPPQLPEDLARIFRLNNSKSGDPFNIPVWDDGPMPLPNPFNSSASQLEYPFKCMMPYYLKSSKDSLLLVCGISKAAGGLINQFDPTNNSTIENFSVNYTAERELGSTWVANNRGSSVKWGVELGHTFFIMQLRGYRDLGYDDVDNGAVSFNGTVGEEGPWLKFTPVASGAYSFRATLCFDTLYQTSRWSRRYHPQDFPIVARRGNLQSNAIGIFPKWSVKKGRFDTTGLRQQLVDTGSSAPDRTVLELDLNSVNVDLEGYANHWSPNATAHFKNRYGEDVFYYTNTSWDGTLGKTNISLTYHSLPFGKVHSDFLNAVVWQPLGYESINSYDDPIPVTVTGEIKCCGARLVNSSLHPSWNALLEDVLEETDNPALAWQALTTAVMSAAYYDWLPFFSLSENITTSSIVSRHIPIFRKGLWIVLANLLLHLCLVAITFAWFVNTTKYSLLNNAWQTVSQLQSPETAELLEAATMADDKGVRDWIHASGKGGLRLRLRQKPENGRVSLVKCHSDFEDFETQTAQDNEEEEAEAEARSRSVEYETLSRHSSGGFSSGPESPVSWNAAFGRG